MLRTFRLLLVAAFACLAFVIGWLAWFAMTPVALPAASVDFSIAPGSSLRSATQQIIASGIPIPARLFNVLARLSGKATHVKAGSYEIALGETPWTHPGRACRR